MFDNYVAIILQPFCVFSTLSKTRKVTIQSDHFSIHVIVKREGEPQKRNLLGPGGGSHCAPPLYHVFVYICANTRTNVLTKLDFSRLRVWKRAVRFLSNEINSFR